MKEKISILIPVYNVENYLRFCLDSILQQKEQIYEIILVDDGSTDDSRNICDKYREEYPEIIQVYHRNNQGAYASRNFAFDQSSGEYVWFIDPDDYISEETISVIREKIIAYNQPDVVTLTYRKFKHDAFFDYENKPEFEGVVSGKDYLKQGNLCPYLWARVYKKEFLLNNNIRFNDKIYSQGDWLYNIKVNLVAKSILQTDIHAYNYNIGNSNSTLNLPSAKHKKKTLANTIIALSELKDIMSNCDKIVLPYLERQCSLTSTGYLYALMVPNFEWRFVLEKVEELHKLSLYPVKYSSNNKKSELFRHFANMKYLFIFVSWLRNHLLTYNLND